MYARGATSGLVLTGFFFTTYRVIRRSRATHTGRETNNRKERPMLHLVAILAATSVAAGAPTTAPAPVQTASSSSPTNVAMRGTAPAAKKPNLELPAWTRELTVGQQQEAMRAQLDQEFEIFRSP